MTVTTKPLSDSVGAEVLDVDRDRLLHDDALADECLELLDRHGVLVFRELHLDDETQVAFSRRLGPVERVGRRDDGAEIFRVTLDPAKNPAADYLKGTFDWHIDGMTDDIPIMATVLSAHEVAAKGGDTEFASTYAAYEDALRRGEGAGAGHAGGALVPRRPEALAPERVRGRHRVLEQAAAEDASAGLAARERTQVAGARRDDRPRRGDERGRGHAPTSPTCSTVRRCPSGCTGTSGRSATS